jgi:hypothetical protein
VAAVSRHDERGSGRGARFTKWLIGTRRPYSGQVGAESGAESGADDNRDIEAANRALGMSTGWNVFGYLTGGMIAYGAIGWLIGRAVHIYMLFPIGMLVGLAISVGWVIYRYGRQ